MDIQVRFEDGSTELRPDNCPALYDEGRESPKRWPAWTPSDVTDGEAFPMHWGAGMGYRFLARGEDRYASRLSHFREFKTSRGNVLTPLLWRDGRWRAVAHVETVDDQIARLTAERDAAVKERDAYWIRGFATALAASSSGGGQTVAYQMGAACLTLDKLRASDVPESDIEAIASAMRRGQ